LGNSRISTVPSFSNTGIAGEQGLGFGEGLGLDPEEAADRASM